MKRYNITKLCNIIVLMCSGLAVNTAIAVPFTISTAETTAQTLDGDGEEGRIETSGSLTIRGDAITVSGADNIIYNAGTINTTGFRGDGIVLQGEQAMVTNDGTISIAGEFALGVSSTGADTTIINRGGINTAGARGDGIVLQGEQAMITNHGSINTTGGGSNGIVLQGGHAIIANHGSISTAGIGSHGIALAGTDARIINHNTIITAGQGAHGIIVDVDGVDAVITNNENAGIITIGAEAAGIFLAEDSEGAAIINHGTIMTMMGISSHSIHSYATNAIITNRGTINTMTQLSNGIFSQGENVMIANHGTIRTMSFETRGIYSEGAGAVITNDNMIITTASLAESIYSEGADATITNHGSIIARGEEAYGISSQGDDAAITNDGTITAMEAFSGGIVSVSTDAMITNDGTIMTMGENTRGVFLAQDGLAATVVNRGTVMAMGEGAYGIYLEQLIPQIITDFVTLIPGRSESTTTIVNSGTVMAASTTNADGSVVPGVAIMVVGEIDVDLTLDNGSVIMGAIDLGGGMDSVRFINGFISNTIDFFNVEMIDCARCIIATDESGNQTIANPRTVAAIESTALSAGIVSLSQFNHNIHRVLQSRRLSSNQRVASASSHMVADASGMSWYPLFSTAHAPVAWIQAFGGQFERSAEGGAVGYDHDYRGLVFGYEQDYGQYRFGLLGGVGSSNLAGSGSFAYEQDNYYVGGYSYLGLSETYDAGLTLSVLGGYGRVENERRVIEDRSRIALSDYNIWYLSPSLSLSAAYALSDSVELRPLASIDYNVSWSASYREQGTARSNLSVADSTARVLNMRAQLTTVYKWQPDSEVAVRFGFNRRNSDIDESKISIGENGTTINSFGDNNVQGAFTGVTLGFVLNEHAKISVDMEYGRGQDERHVNGNLHLEWRF